MPSAKINDDDEEEEIEFAPGAGEYDEIVAAILTLGTLGQSATGHDVPTLVDRYREVLKRLQDNE
jgi:hypothetical protein